jgi:predicted alpha/beta superfamily hydrolase
MAFIQQELQPYIEKKYKATGTKTIIGQSLGGLFATEILFKKPEMFNKYIIISPSLWWDNASLLNYSTALLSSAPTHIDIYLGVGKEGLAPTETPHVMEVEANLLAEKIFNAKSRNVKVFFDYLPEETHATISHQAVFNAFRLFYRKTE